MSQNLRPDDTRQQLGTIVRQLHDALQTLGYDAVLHEVAREIPDARERLSYVGRMTEQAALKVLTLVDQAKPACADLARDGQALLEHPGDTEAHPWRAFTARAISQAQAQQTALDEIMMAQDFQDLSGQVINKVIGIITRTEAQLLELLLHSPPPETVIDSTRLAGPQAPGKALKQDDVDDLLASLGF